MNHYIRLLTTEELPEEDMNAWFDTVIQYAPEGSVNDSEPDDGDDVDISSDEDYGDPDFPFVYVVELTRHLEKVEAEFIVAAWDLIYDDDYEIEISNIYNAEADPQNPLEVEIDSDSHAYIEEMAAKFLHNRWVESKIQEGWRYAMYEDESDKTSPLLRDWDSLDESYRNQPIMTKTEAVEFYSKYRSLFK